MPLRVKSHVSSRVPQIQDELEQSIMKTRETIARLPPAPTADPRSEILTLLHTFTQDLSQQIQGVPDGFDSVAELGLIQAIRPEQEKFKRAIRGTAPYFWPFEKSSTTGNLSPAEFLRAEEGELFQSDGGWDGSGWVRSQANQRIYIEDVLQRAQRCVYFMPTFTYMSDIFLQGAHARVAWPLPIRRTEDFH